MKNRPITARVKSGMFKTKEPLLNVGPAGVDGNNKTRTMPSPSKMKGYAMKSSPFKQETNAATDALERNKTTKSYSDGKIYINKEGTKVVPGEMIQKEITKTKDFDKNWDESKYGPYSEWIKNPANKAKEDKFIENQQIGTGKFKEVKGDDKIETTNDKFVAKIARKGQAQTAFESRNNLRRGLQANRKTKKAEIKNARSKAKGGGYYKTSAPDADGNTTREFVKASENKGVKETRKEVRKANRRRKENDKEAREGLEGKEKRLQRKADRRLRKNLKKTKIDKAKDRAKGFKDEKSDIKAMQNERNRQLGLSESRNAQIQSTQGKSGFSTGDKSLVLDQVDMQQGEDSLNDQLNAAPNKMGKPGFFKKKSPMKMNYFKK